MPTRRLWSRGDLSGLSNERLEEALELVWTLPDAAIRNNPNQLIDEIVDRFGFQSIALDLSAMTRSEIGAGRYGRLGPGGFEQVQGQVFTVHIPFSGSPELLRFQPSTRAVPESVIYIADNAAELRAGMAIERLTKEEVASQVGKFRDEIVKFAAWGNEDAKRFNVQLRERISAKVLDRKLLLDDTAELDASLEIPIAVVPAESKVPIPIARKRVRIESIGSQETQEEFHLADAVYEDVLQTLVSFGRAMERLPITARKFNEEGIRDVALFILNANYQGEAAGEVFNGAGKTDIMLSFRNRSAFIGEFKFWNGQKKFHAAVDQLLSYTVWRDTKAALILMIKNVRATTAIREADAAIRSHAQFRETKKAHEPDLRSDYVMSSNSDPDRYISVALIPVVIPNPSQKA